MDTKSFFKILLMDTKFYPKNRVETFRIDGYKILFQKFKFYSMDTKSYFRNLKLCSGAGAVRAHDARFPRGWERGLYRNGDGRTGAALHSGQPLSVLDASERQIKLTSTRLHSESDYNRAGTDSRKVRFASKLPQGWT